MRKDGDKEKCLFEAMFGGGGIAVGLGGLEVILESIMKPDHVLIRIAKFIDDYNATKASYDSGKKSIELAIKSIVEEFGIEKLENSLKHSFFEHKNCNTEDCQGRYFIEKFIDLAGTTVFSESFTSWWQSTRPVVFTIGKNNFTINSEIRTPVDDLIAIMDRIDYYKNNVEPMPFPFISGKVNFNMSLMKPLLTEWSTFVMALEKLIRYGSECDDKECAGCVFIKRLVERLGLDNLPEATQALYRKIFLPN